MVTIAKVAARTRSATQPIGTESSATATPTRGQDEERLVPGPHPVWVKRMPIA